MRFLIEGIRSRFSEMCFPPKAGSTFLKKSEEKEVARKMQAKWYFECCIFDANSCKGPCGISFLHFARRVPSEMKITKTRWTVDLGWPGGMRRGAGGKFEGG